jgi:hypothetical protein
LIAGKIIQLLMGDYQRHPKAADGKLWMLMSVFFI